MAVKQEKTEKTQPKIGKATPVKKAKTEEKQLRIELIRSVVGCPRYQREVVKGLGLRRINSFAVRKDTPEIWGMIKKIPHMLKIESLEKK
jgi:large subunit ribosomal protein L30